MEYQKKSIIQIVKDIEENKVFLPALQRKFVWSKGQIQTLFDSIMRDYPIGTFLFWKLSAEGAKPYVFYEFLKDYDERAPFNRKFEGEFLQQEIIGVLDGQQRLSSLYVGLQGTHTEKAPYKKHRNPNAFQKTKLYLNLLSLPYLVNEDEDEIYIKEDKNFEFKFLTEDQSKNWIARKSLNVEEEQGEEAMFWFKVGEALGWKKDFEVEKIINQCIRECRSDKQRQEIENNKRLVTKVFRDLHDRLTKSHLINYFEVEKQDLEDILKIFVRVNSAGTQLSKTDLLFSTIVANWDNGREKIEDLMKKINGLGTGFGFTNEYLMRNCLVLTDCPVSYKVHSFASENVKKIKSEWENIASAIEKTVQVLVDLGFEGSTLTSQNATILIAYYIYKGGVVDEKAKKEFKRYIVHSLLKGVYGGTQEQVISFLRNAVRQEIRLDDGSVAFTLKSKSFSFDDLLRLQLPVQKSFVISQDDLDRFLEFPKGPASFYLLSLLYPNLKYSEVKFHQDHIHPASKFSDEVFDQLGLTQEQRGEWLRLRDLLPNLQLMEGTQNSQKQASSFKDWISGLDPHSAELFFQQNYIPNDELDFSNFINFFAKRKKILKDALANVLAIAPVVAFAEEAEAVEVDDIVSDEDLLLEE